MVMLCSMTATATPQKLGPSQIAVLSALKDNPTGLTPPQVRDLASLPEGDYGTRRAHAILGRLAETGLVAREEMSEKVAAKNVHEASGRKAKVRFKINAEGKKALKASS